MCVRITKLVVVLGMHRSGTSAITRSMQVLGVELGGSLMPSGVDNPKGYWEDIDINSLNDEMLSTLNSDWHYLSTIENDDFETLYDKGYLNRGVNLLKHKIGNSSNFAFKDPRVSKLLPFWQKVFKLCHLDVSYILALRHPLSVAKSLEKRDGFDVEKSHLLWLGHIISSLCGTTDEKLVIVDYDRMIQSPDREIARIAINIGLEIDQEKLQLYKTEFIEQDLRHTTFDLDDLLSDDICPPIVKEIYSNLLVNIASDNLKINDVALQAKFLHWSDEFEHLKSPLSLIDKLFTHAVNRDEEIDYLSKTLAIRKSQLAERENQLDELINTTSWRITAPLRFASHQLRKFLNALIKS